MDGSAQYVRPIAMLKNTIEKGMRKPWRECVVAEVAKWRCEAVCASRVTMAADVDASIVMHIPNVHVAAGVLKSYLSEMPDPLLTSSRFVDYREAMSA